MLRRFQYHDALRFIRACAGQHRTFSSNSLAKALACLPEEEQIQKPLTRSDLKKYLENKIKKRVKAQFTEGKFHNLMGSVVINPATLADAYDIIRLDSNLDLSSPKDDLCFTSLSDELASSFSLTSNIFSIGSNFHGCKPLILPNLKLRVILQAIRVSLEIIYRPHFSKLSHGCRRERGHLSAINFICRDLSNKIDWWFTLPMNSPADDKIISKMILIMEKRIKDERLFKFIFDLFRVGVLNLSFGCFPKLHGLPQEGILSSILINIYLNELDQELVRIFMEYECLKLGQKAKLRDWIRRKINGEDKMGSMFHACRVLDEVIIVGNGNLGTACAVRDEVAEFLESSLFIQSSHPAKILSVDCPHGIQFVGLAMGILEEEKTRAVHKLRDKVKAFSKMRMEAWEALMVHLGKKWLAHGLKKLKESEIHSLQRSTETLDMISQFRKEGMKTDHWFKVLMKVWLQNAGGAASEEEVLSKLVAEPAMPEDLRQAIHDFKDRVEEYLLKEEKSALELLSEGGGERRKLGAEVLVKFIRQRLVRYGLVYSGGNPRCVRDLVLQDDALILLWFSGLVQRWRSWFAVGEKLPEAKVRRSCIRTLAVKHRMSEEEIERRFGDELDGVFIPAEFAGEREEQEIYSGLCLLSLEEVAAVRCSVVGCTAGTTEIYGLRVKEMQNFPGWKTGFAPAIFPGLHRRRIAMCRKHVGDLYSGVISLNSVDFGSII